MGSVCSATTIATVLRSSGLGPAPRRIGPTGSEFLRAQAYGMLGGDLRRAAGDGLERDASEPSGAAPHEEAACQEEADDHLSPAAANEPRWASRPLPAAEPPGAAAAVRSPCDSRIVPLRPSHRSHARDGPPSADRRLPTTPCSGRTSSRRRHPTSVPATPGRVLLGSSQRSSASRRQRNGPTTTQAGSLNRVSLPHRVLPEPHMWHRSQCLQWLHSAFARVRRRSLDEAEVPGK